MRQRMDEICSRGAAEQIRKQINDMVFWIEQERIRRARAELLDYRRRIEDYRRSSEERETCPNCGVKRLRISTQPPPAFQEAFRTFPSGSGESQPELRRWLRQGNIVRSIFDVARSNQGEGSSNRTTEQINAVIRGILEERRRFLLTGVRGFVGPLPRPIGLLEDSVREGRRAWALPSPFEDPLYRRNIVSPFRRPSYLPRYPVGTWEH